MTAGPEYPVVICRTEVLLQDSADYPAVEIPGTVSFLKEADGFISIGWGGSCKQPRAQILAQNIATQSNVEANKLHIVAPQNASRHAYSRRK